MHLIKSLINLLKKRFLFEVLTTSMLSSAAAGMLRLESFHTIRDHCSSPQPSHLSGQQRTAGPLRQVLLAARQTVRIIEAARLLSLKGNCPELSVADIDNKEDNLSTINVLGDPQTTLNSSGRYSKMQYAP